MIETHESQGYCSQSIYTIDKAQKKLALPLWVKLQHAYPQQVFDVLLTLSEKPDSGQVDTLLKLGLTIPEFYRDNPDTRLPGSISKTQLERELIYCDFIRYIEGTPRTEYVRAD